MEADVAVIGFGPVGAVTAGLLGKHGLRVLVIEKDEAVFPLPRAALRRTTVRLPSGMNYAGLLTE